MSINPPKLALRNLAEENNGSDYQKLLGNKAWLRLHPDIQQRFGSKVHQAVTYQGVMKVVYSSFLGKAFAQVCRLIGTPLAIHSGVDVPIMVKVYPNETLEGMTWDRFYAFPNKPVNRVTSTKVIQNKQGENKASLVELVGCGFGMKLDVNEVKGALRFSSTEFFLQIANRKIPIPDWLSPGKTVVEQRALSDGRFEFSLVVKHVFLGEVFKQVGVFKAK